MDNDSLKLKSVNYKENKKSGKAFMLNKINYDWKELKNFTELSNTLQSTKIQYHSNYSYNFFKPTIMSKIEDYTEIDMLLCEKDNILHMSVCLPCYDEEWCEISGTIRSLVKNILVQKKRPNKSFKLNLTLYLIQDGWKNASNSFKEGIENDLCFPSKKWFNSKFVVNNESIIVVIPENEIYYPAYNNENELCGITFYPIFITKNKNAQKYNSHLIFFSLCYLQIPHFVFLTDCGTLYNSDCITKLVECLYKKHKNIIGVTAKQRVMSANDRNEIQQYPFWYKKKRESFCTKLFKKIYWWFSPAPLQGFEFESSFIINTLMFNVFGILPVLPGPCQLLWWDYFQNDSNDGILDVYFKHLNINPSNSSILKTNTLLAEDRILSFAMVLRTFNLKTVWINGATFLYEPMLSWNKLLGQRRRWINGTISTFLYYLIDNIGKDELAMSGLANNNSIKILWIIQLYQSILQIFSPAFFSISLYESLLQIMKRFDFLKNLIPHFQFEVANFKIFLYPELLLTLFYFSFYVSWVFVALLFGKKTIFCSRNFYNVIIEIVYLFFTFINSLVSILIFYGIFISYKELGPLFYTLVFIWILPFIISLCFSPSSSLSYLLYSIPFFTNICQYVCFIPAFALARVHDISWGNRDSTMEIDKKTISKYFRTTLKINFFTVLINFIILISYIITVNILGHNQIIFISIFMLLFFSIIIQFLFTLIYFVKTLFKSCYKKIKYKEDDNENLTIISNETQKISSIISNETQRTSTSIV